MFWFFFRLLSKFNNLSLLACAALRSHRSDWFFVIIYTITSTRALISGQRSEIHVKNKSNEMRKQRPWGERCTMSATKFSRMGVSPRSGFCRIYCRSWSAFETSRILFYRWSFRQQCDGRRTESQYGTACRASCSSRLPKKKDWILQVQSGGFRTARKKAYPKLYRYSVGVTTEMQNTVMPRCPGFGRTLDLREYNLCLQ